MTDVAVAEPLGVDEHGVPSQSTKIARTARRLPDVSPFVHSVLRVRLKKVTYPVRRVTSQASSFMKPTISTSRLA